MLTVKKLLSLKERTRTRKISLILSEAAREAKTGKNIDLTYINSIVCLVDLAPVESDLDLKHLAFRLEDYAQSLLVRLGAQPSDWDFIDSSGNLDVSKRVIQDKIIVIDRIRSPFNVGSVFRSADSFGIKKIILVDGSASPEHSRARRTSRGTIDTVQWQYMSEEEAVSLLSGYSGKSVIALELGGEDINTFEFPESGAVVIGSEEFGISPEIMKCCTATVSIPMAGTKGSLNVSVATGILLQHWFSYNC